MSEQPSIGRDRCPTMAVEHDSSPAEAPARVAAIAPGRPGNSVVNAARAAPSPPSLGHRHRHRHRQPVARWWRKASRTATPRRGAPTATTSPPCPHPRYTPNPTPPGQRSSPTSPTPSYGNNANNACFMVLILLDSNRSGIKPGALQDNLNTLRTYQHHRTPPPVTTRTAPRTTPTRTAPPPTINRNQDRGRGYGR